MILVLDLGSHRLGAIAAESRLPLRILAAATGPVDSANLAPPVEEARAVLVRGDVEAMVLEIAPRFFAPKNATPQAITAMAEAYAVCSRLAERLEMLAAEFGVPVHRIARQTWAHRVVPHARGISEEMAHAGIRAQTEPEGWAALRDEHQRDAAGAAIGYLVGLEQEERAKGKTKRAGRSVRVGGEREAAPPPKTDAIVEAIAAHGRPIRADVLAVRLAVTTGQLNTWLSTALKSGRVVRPQRGIYALP